MTAVIQDGKMSAPGQGGLFQGKTFWLSRAVPQRSHITQQIMANGGSVVANEKDADICIVDHMKSTTEGMFSYEYVTKSLIAQKLEELEKHRVVPKHKHTGSASSRLRGHNFFSQEEDDILLETLSGPGVKLSGNAVYKKLADQYPQHTMHSWRGRWIDHLSKLMPHGPVPPKKRGAEREVIDQKEKDVEQIPAKRENERFTKEDETLPEKRADRIAASPDQTDSKEAPSKMNPQHTPDRQHAHSKEVTLSKMNREGVPKKSAAKPNQPTAESKGHSRGPSNEESVVSSSRVKPSSKVKQEVKFKPESSPGLKQKKGPPTPNAQSPIRTVDVRNRPNGTPRKEMTKSSTPHQRHKVTTTTSSSPSHQPTTPTGRAASISSSEVSLSAITPSKMRAQNSADHIPRWRAEVHRTKDKDASDILPLSPPKPLSTHQKRKRDPGSSPELRKKSRNIHENTHPDPESPPQSRPLSPELLGSDAHHLANSLPLPSPKKKLNYADLSTQAIYDQLDDDPSMEFPEIEIPDTPPPHLAQPTPGPQVQRKPSTPTKLSAPTPGPPLLSPTKADPDGIREMNTFLAYCQKEFGASEKQVIYAIERASGIKQLVELVLRSVVDDKPLPTHVPGVWSEEDDKVLMGADSREMKRLQERKGAAHMERRMEFLNLWNMA